MKQAAQAIFDFEKIALRSDYGVFRERMKGLHQCLWRELPMQKPTRNYGLVRTVRISRNSLSLADVPVTRPLNCVSISL